MDGFAPQKQLSAPPSREIRNEECTVEDPPSDSESPICDDAEVASSSQPRELKRDKSRRTRGRKETRKGRSAMYHDLKVFEEAERNQVIFGSFSLIEQMEMRSAPPVIDDAQWVLWNDITPRVALDNDGIPVLYHFSKLLLEAITEKYTNVCLCAGEKLTLAFGGPENENSKSSCVLTDGEVAGRIDFAYAVAPEMTENPVLPSQFLLENLQPPKSLMNDTGLLSRRVNNLVSLIDPPFYDGLERLQEIIGGYPGVQRIVALDPMLMEGRSIAFNQKTPLETNDGDFEAGWRALVSLGSFTEGGYVRIPRLGLRVRFLPGDVLVLRGAFLEYEVETWSGGQKVFLEHFTRGDLWRHAGVEL